MRQAVRPELMGGRGNRSIHSRMAYIHDVQQSPRHDPEHAQKDLLPCPPRSFSSPRSMTQIRSIKTVASEAVSAGSRSRTRPRMVNRPGSDGGSPVWICHAAVG